MGGYISFAKFNKNHLYIVYSIIFLILKDVVFGYNYNDSFKPLFSDQAYENFSEHYLIKNILCYIVTFFISLFFYCRERKKLGKKSSSRLSQNPKIKYFQFNNKNNFFTKTNLVLILIIFLWILDELLIQIFSFLKDLDFWMIEIIIISYMTSRMFKEKIYLHHKMIIYLNLFSIIFKVMTIALSFNDTCNEVNDEDYYYCYNYNYEINNFNMCLSKNETTYLNNKENINLDGGLKNYYVVNTHMVPIGIAVYLILITLRSYVNSKIKWLMDLKYISENLLLIIYGFIGTIICSIICIITTLNKCKDLNAQNKSDFFDYICKVEYNNETYIDNFESFHNTISKKKSTFIEILKTCVGIIFFFFNKYYSMLIIKNFTPVHLIFSFPVYYATQKIVLIINTLIREKTFFSVNRINYIESKFTLDFTGDILSSIGFLVYLEIIELNFCGLNYNLKRKISERAFFEIYGSLGNDDDEEESESEEEKKEEDEAPNEKEMKKMTIN